MENKQYKKLYTFTLHKKRKNKIEVAKEIDGKNVTVLEEVEELIPCNYFIRKPSRIEKDEASLFESLEFSNLVRKGIITRSEVIKRFTAEDVTIEKVYKSYAEKENELQRLSLQEKTDEINERIAKLQQELFGLLVEMQDFETTKSSEFNRTADVIARNKAVLWWILALAYKIDGDKELPLFDGHSFEEKQLNYDKIIEELENSKDEHLIEAVQRFFYLIPAWYSGRAVSPEDFRKLEDSLKYEIQKEKDRLAALAKEEQKIEAESTEPVN